MIKRIKASKLPTFEDLDVEVLVVEHDNYFTAHLGKLVKIPLLRLL